MGSEKGKSSNQDLVGKKRIPRFERGYYIASIPGMLQLIQLQLNFICLIRSRSTLDCYYLYHKTGLIWFTLAAVSGLCITGYAFLLNTLNYIKRSNRGVWLLDSILCFTWASIYSSAVANIISNTQNYNNRTIITPEFCSKEDITSMHIVIWIDASCRKLLIAGVLAVVAYGVDGTLKCYGFLTLYTFNNENLDLKITDSTNDAKTRPLSPTTCINKPQDVRPQRSLLPACTDMISSLNSPQQRPRHRPLNLETLKRTPSKETQRQPSATELKRLLENSTDTSKQLDPSSEPPTKDNSTQPMSSNESQTETIRSLNARRGGGLLKRSHKTLLPSRHFVVQTRVGNVQSYHSMGTEEKPAVSRKSSLQRVRPDDICS